MYITLKYRTYSLSAFVPSVLNQTKFHYLKSDQNHTKNLIEFVPLFIKRNTEIFQAWYFHVNAYHYYNTRAPVMFCFRHIFKLEIFLFPGYVFDVESILNSWETAEGRARRRCSFLSRFDVCGFRRPVHRSYYDLSGAIYWWIWVTLRTGNLMLSM